jgi:hypothetical protein
VVFDTGPSHSARSCQKRRLSTAMRIERELTRQTFGGSLRILAIRDQWPTPAVHRNLCRVSYFPSDVPGTNSSYHRAHRLYKHRRIIRARCSRSGNVFFRPEQKDIDTSRRRKSSSRFKLNGDEGIEPSASWLQTRRSKRTPGPRGVKLTIPTSPPREWHSALRRASGRRASTHGCRHLRANRDAM